MGKAIFITGGSGYIGSTVISHAIAAGYTVTALSRTPESDAKLSSLGATPIRGELTSFSVLTDSAATADIVISIADSITGNFTITLEERFRINDAATDAIAKGLKGSGKALILTSGSLSSAADPEGKETDETSPLWPEGHWLRAPDRDELVGRYMKDGIRVCHIRLAPYVYGLGGSGIKLFMGMFAQAGAGMKVDEGKACTTAVHVNDAARLYLLIAEEGKAGEAYNATSENNITQGQLVEAVCKAVGVPCKAVTYKEAAATVNDFLAGFLSIENKASSRKARDELGWETNERGIMDDIERGSYVEVAKALKAGRKP